MQHSLCLCPVMSRYTSDSKICWSTLGQYNHSLAMATVQPSTPLVHAPKLLSNRTSPRRSSCRRFLLDLPPLGREAWRAAASEAASANRLLAALRRCDAYGGQTGFDANTTCRQPSTVGTYHMRFYFPCKPLLRHTRPASPE